MDTSNDYDARQIAQSYFERNFGIPTHLSLNYDPSNARTFILSFYDGYFIANLHQSPDILPNIATYFYIDEDNEEETIHINMEELTDHKNTYSLSYMIYLDQLVNGFAVPDGVLNDHKFMSFTGLTEICFGLKRKNLLYLLKLPELIKTHSHDGVYKLLYDTFYAKETADDLADQFAHLW